MCFGEILWDILPTRNSLGGAPFNVGRHLNMLGQNVDMISRVGNDELGKQIITKAKYFGISTELIQVDNKYNTGTVEVSLDNIGNATYPISRPVAWDFISLEESILKISPKVDYFIYGTLAQRSNVSRKTCEVLRNSSKVKVYDFNLRPPFLTKELLKNLYMMLNLLR